MMGDLKRHAGDSRSHARRECPTLPNMSQEKPEVNENMLRFSSMGAEGREEEEGEDAFVGPSGPVRGHDVIVSALMVDDGERIDSGSPDDPLYLVGARQGVTC